MWWILGTVVGVVAALALMVLGFNLGVAALGRAAGLDKLPWLRSYKRRK